MRQIEIKGKWAIITGAASGIGLEFARTLAQKKMNVALIDIDSSALERESKSITAEYGTQALPLTMDLTRPEAPELIVSMLRERHIRPFIFINNAGVFNFLEVTNMSPSRINIFIDLHVRAVTQLSRLMAQIMARQEEKGYILNMSSLSCWTPVPGIALYAATKAYIRVFTRALALEMRDKGVKIMVCCPGGIATDLFGLPPKLRRLAVNIGALQTPERFVKNALRQLLRGRMQYVNGPINRLAIVAMGASPTWLRMQVKRQMLDKGITR